MMATTEEREARRAHDAAYRAAHREERRAYSAAHNAAYKVAHREEARAYQAAYYAAHKEGAAETSREYRAAHRDELLAYSREYHTSVRQERRNDRQSFLAAMKDGVGCADCGATNNLHFHHRDKSAKSFTISNAVLLPWPDLMTEVFKCDVLCGSCHPQRHVGMRTEEEVTA